MRRNLQKIENLLPAAPQKASMQQLGQLRHEVVGLRNENYNLRPLKDETARLRASLADYFFSHSEAPSVHSA